MELCRACLRHWLLRTQELGFQHRTTSGAPFASGAREHRREESQGCVFPLLFRCSLLIAGLATAFLGASLPSLWLSGLLRGKGV